MLKRIDPIIDSPAPAGPARPDRNIFARHLVHVFPTFDIGGAQVRFVALVEALGARYFHTVISLSNSYGAAELLPPGAPVSLIAPPAATGSLPQRLSRNRDQLRHLAPDLLVTYNWGAIEFALANLSSRLPHLHVEDGFGPEETTRQLARRVWTRRLALPRSQVVAPSSTLQRIATTQWGLPASRVHHIPNGVAPRPKEADDLAARGVQLRADRPRIVWAGALRPEKNPVRLLRAFAPLRDRATLLMIGDGPEREAVLTEARRLQLGDSLHLAGRRHDTRDLIMHCDLLALSSDTEQMPLVVLEAMDAGLPVGSVDVGDVRAMLAPENRAYVTPLSTGALSHALALLAGGPAIRKAIGEANRRRVREIYTLPRMAAAYENLIEGLLAETRGGSAPCLVTRRGG